MQGQSNHFTRYAPEHIEYGVNRYQTETRRLYQVLDDHLKTSTSGYLVGDKCTIADIDHYGWIVSHSSVLDQVQVILTFPKASAFWAGVDITKFPHLEAWEERMSARPGVQKGKDIPTPHRMKELQKDPKRMQEHAEKARQWVQAGMADDAKKHAKQVGVQMTHVFSWSGINIVDDSGPQTDLNWQVTENPMNALGTIN